MKLEKKHYTWIAGIILILAIIAIYMNWDKISSLWSKSANTRMFRTGGTVSGTAGSGTTGFGTGGLGQGFSSGNGVAFSNVGYIGYTYPYAEAKWSCIDRADGVNCTKCQSSDGMTATGGACGNL